MKINIELVNTASGFESAKKLFLEYAAWLDFDLCFQGFEKELATLPEFYGHPGGIWLAYFDEELAGCAALRKINDKVCEMKRLFVRDKFRGMKIGRLLSEKLIQVAKENGFEKMKLDTLERMNAAVALYRSMGFKETEPYRNNPMPDVIYMEINLK